ncbi:MAG: S-layer homology domain-containing protein [Clostridia bacterium]|nr:S-layer homology domain-containing protein [Clostridia bacterium]
MASRKLAIAILTVLAAVSVCALPGRICAAPPVLKDVAGHWAEGAITSLAKMGVLEGYPDQTFQPENLITRAELAKVVARAFGYAPTMDTKFCDMDGHWAEPFVSALDAAKVVTGYPDSTFRPDTNVTRAEMTAMLARVAQLGDMGATDAQAWTPSFRDVDASHWAFRFVEIARRLDTIPLHFGMVFEPERAATRAETAFMVKALSDAQFARGTVTQVSAMSETITLKNVAGSTQVVQVGADTLLYRNGVASTLDSVRSNDSVYVVGTSYGSARFIKAEGVVTKEDITRKVSALTHGVITPDQVDAISRGKWDEARAGMSPALTQRLMDMGLTETEVGAVLSQQWSLLPDLAQKRLAQALSEELGVSSDLIAAVMARDWQAARSYAELEAAQVLLSKFLKM